MRRSGELPDVAMAESLAATRPGVSELEAETQGIVAFRTAAGRDESAVVDCIPIVLSGPRGSMPHEFTSGHCFAPGEPMWHCWITSYGGYWTENIRTAAVAPYDSRFLDDLFACLTHGLLAGQEKARPGNRAQQVFEAVMSELRRSTYPGAVLLTRAGHGMGLEYHEPPFVEASDETELEPGMVITVELGIWYARNRRLQPLEHDRHRRGRERDPERRPPSTSTSRAEGARECAQLSGRRRRRHRRDVHRPRSS